MENPKAIILAGPPGAGKSSIPLNCNFERLNLDDCVISFIKEEGISLDLKNHNANERSIAAQCMAKAVKKHNKLVDDVITNKESVIFDQTCASVNKTKELIERLEYNDYDVFMIFVYCSLGECLQRNNQRFEKSEGKDRSLQPNIVMHTWYNVVENHNIYKEILGERFVTINTGNKFENTQNLKGIKEVFIIPYTPIDIKPLTENQRFNKEYQQEILESNIESLDLSSILYYAIDAQYEINEIKEIVDDFINE